MNNFLFFVLVFNILSCGGAPERRALPGPSPLPIDSIRLNDKMGVQDFRKIFKALNQNGKLSSLKPWFENVPDSDLEKFAQVISSELYEKAFETEGLLQVLTERNNRRGFTEWKEKSPFNNGRYSSSVWNYLTFPEFTKLLPSHLSFLDLSFQKIVNGFATQYKSKINTDCLAVEIQTLLSNSAFKKELQKLASSLSENGKFERLVHALANESQQNPKAFFSFAQALSNFSESRLSELFDSIKVIDDKPNGLFSVADSYLKNNDEYRRSIAREFQQYLTQGLVENTVNSLISSSRISTIQNLILKLPRTEPSNPPTAEFKELLEIIRVALQKNFTINDPVSERLDPVLNLYAYLITKTFEDVSKLNLEKLSGKPENFWKTPLTVDKIKMVLSNSTSGELNAQVHKDLESLGMQKEVDLLKPQLFNKEIFPSNLYVVNFEEKKATLEQILTQSIEKLIALKPLTEPGTILNMLITRFDLKSFESSDNFLTLIHTAVAGLSVNEIDSLDNLLFHKLELHNFTPERLALVLEMFGDREDLKGKVTKLFRCLTLLHEFHHEGFDGMSALHLPWTYLNQLGPIAKNANVFNLFFSTFRESGIFDKETKTPELKKTFQDPNILSQFLISVSKLSEEELTLVASNFKQLNLKDNLALIQKLISDSPEGFDTLIRTLLQEGVNFLPTETAVTEKERIWLNQFSRSKNFNSATKLFNQYGSRENFRLLITDLLALSNSGELSKALEYLMRIQNDRMKKLASTLLEMEKSHELEKLLLILKSF